MIKEAPIFKQMNQTAQNDKTRREKLAGYFFDLSKLSFAGLVVGGLVSIKSDNTDHVIDIYRVIAGCIFRIKNKVFSMFLLIPIIEIT
jgi:hypothetical protein